MEERILVCKMGWKNMILEFFGQWLAMVYVRHPLKTITKRKKKKKTSEKRKRKYVTVGPRLLCLVEFFVLDE